MTSPSPRTRPQPGRFGGLDGLRAIAVGLVLVYHFFPRALPGGFLGVDIFFAISGFLITSLLFREVELRGGIRLGAFWRRRARRLLPALGLVLLVCSSLALLVGGDLLVGLGRQIAGTAFFVSNWVFIANGADYFARDTPELFRNTWSLSIEEQFYILLPLLIIALMRLRGRSSRAVLLTALGIASAALMFTLSQQGANPTRIYFGSDTHTFGLFWGAALATLVHPRRDAAPRARLTRLRQLLLGALAATALGVLAWLAITLPEGSAQSFEGGFQLAIVASLALVWAVTRDGAWIGRALDVAPLRWVGERSYGIYLWHWPLLLIVSAALGAGATPWSVALIAGAATFFAAALSYRFLEQPVRRFGLRRSLRLAVRPAGYTPRQRGVTIALGAVLLLTIPATAVAIVQAPEQTTAAAAIARGQDALDAAAEKPAAEQPGSTRPGAGTPSAPDGSDPKPGAGEEPALPPGPLLPRGDSITALGDSVMLASLPELETALPGIEVDAAVSRGMGVGVELADEWAASGRLRPILVVGLGTNGPVAPEELDALARTAGDRPIVLVNAHADRDWIPGVNEELERFADGRRGVVVADWTGAVTGVPDALAGDDIHPNPSGGEIYAASVQRALEELQAPGEARGFALPRR
ncbi:acyltransferase family protein [Leucobacter chromiireducens]|uniref:acyltransferase family protein n=1 Tax=Leucobacter chromiireducens TaxID=283877 RepID=UPI000F62CC3E|nr:acyltransferase family protein [Leucobacter chromiireducens]